MSLTRFTPSDLVAAMGRVAYVAGWRGEYPTWRQVAVFRDREIPLPRTKGEASDAIDEIAAKEGWGDDTADVD